MTTECHSFLEERQLQRTCTTEN